MEALLASFPPGSAYMINVPQLALTIPSVLYLPKSGDGAWYIPTFSIINVSTIKDVSWTGNAFQFSTSLRLGTGPGPFQVNGTIGEGGAIRGSLETLSSTSRVPFREFSGTPN
jgi:hypothetical protein